MALSKPLWRLHVDINELLAAADGHSDHNLHPMCIIKYEVVYQNNRKNWKG